jgi:hypothetical protein
MDALQLQLNDRDGCILKFEAKQRDDAVTDLELRRTIELLRERLATMGNSRSVTVAGTIATQNQPEGRGTNMDSNFVEQPDDMNTIEACDEKRPIEVGRKSAKNPLQVDAVQVAVPSQEFTEQLPA